MATIKEIAKRANVSIGTVDRVLHNRGNVAPEKEKKIRKIIAELNYKPNVYAKALKLSKEYHIGVLMPYEDQDSGYWKLPISGMKEAAQELKIQKVKLRFFHYDRYSEESFLKTAKLVLEKSLDGLLIAPVLMRAMDKLINQIPKTLPYVFFDSTIPDAECLSFIGQDSFQSGILAAKLLNNLLHTSRSVAVIRILPEDFHIEQRIKGFLSYMSQVDNIEILTYNVQGDEGQKGFMKINDEIFWNNPNVTGIFVTNALTYHFAEIIQNQNKQDNIRIIGYDLIPQNIHFLKEGVIDFLINQMPKAQGYRGIYTLFRHVVLKEDIQPRIMMPIDILTKENIDYYQG